MKFLQYTSVCNTGKKALIFLLILTVFSKIHAQQENIVLRFWVDFADNAEVLFIHSQIKLYEQQHPGVNIQLEVFKDFQTFFLDRYQSTLENELPDIIRGVSDGISLFADNNMIQPLDTKISPDFLSDFHQVFLKSARYNGKLYGIPISYELLGVYVNAELQPEPLKDMNDLFALAKRLSKEDLLALATNIAEPYRFIPWYQGFGGRFFDANLDPVIDKKAFADACRFLLVLLDQKKVTSRAISNETGLVLFADGLAAAMISGPWDLDRVINEEVPFFVQAFPALADGRQPCPYIGMKMLMLSNTSRHPEAATDFIRFLSRKEAQLQAFDAIYSLPTRADITQISSEKGFKFISGFLVQAQNAVPMPNHPAMAQIWQTLADVLPQVFNHSMQPEEGAELLSAKIDQLR